MPKTEDMIHKQALDSAWSLLKFYGTYEPHGHRAHADKKREELSRLQTRIDDSRPTSDWEREKESQMYAEMRGMLEENPDLKERRARVPGDKEVMWPDPEHYERGARDPSHPDYDRKHGYALPDKNSESRVSTRDTAKNPEYAPGESSMRTEGTGDSVMDPIPDWLVNPGQSADEIHPMYYDRFENPPQLEMPRNEAPKQLTMGRSRSRYNGTY